MYKVTIITKYNTINLEVEDLNTPEMQEIFSQPYILEIRAEEIKTKKLIKEKNNEYRSTKESK